MILELDANSAAPLLSAKLPFSDLNKGDVVAVRVQKRLSAFRYLVHFRGTNLYVNSGELLKPDHLLLLELLQTRPRLTFKLLTQSAGSEAGVPSAGPFLKLMDSGHPLLSLYARWAVRWEFPLKDSDRKRLKSLPKEIPFAREHPSQFLLLHFWLRQHADDRHPEDIYLFYRYLFHSRFREHLASRIRELSAEVTPAGTLTSDQNGGQLAALFGEIFPDQAPSVATLWQQTGRQYLNLEKIARAEEALARLKDAAPGEPEELRAAGALLRLRKRAAVGFRSGAWSCLPLPIRNQPGYLLSFWRQIPVQRKKIIEFMFSWSGNRVKEVAVQGRLDGEHMKLFFVFKGGQDLVSLADNLKAHLEDQIKEAGYRLTHVHFKAADDPQAIIGRHLFRRASNKIEVLL